MSSYENLSFEDFKLWKVRELRVFLRDRGLKITGAKEELVALAYAACQLSVPLKPSAAEEHKVKQKQYSALLDIGGKLYQTRLQSLQPGGLVKKMVYAIGLQSFTFRSQNFS